MAWKKGWIQKLVWCIFLQKEQENVKNIRDEEEKLMVNAWYNLVSGSFISYFIGKIQY